MRAPRSVAVALALALPLAAVTDCADGTCGAGQDQEEAALLQHAAARADLTTETTTATCYPNQATLTCNDPGNPCFLDESCKGGGLCCAAGGVTLCRFCNCFDEKLCDGFPSPTPPAPTPLPTPAPTPAPAGQGVGEECQDSGSTGLYSGECQDGLMCYQPPGALLGAPKYCVQVCNKDYTDKDSEDTPCASGASCSCNVPTPCTPWKGAKDMEGGCYSFCSNAGSGDKCFWPQIPFAPMPAPTPLPTPAPTPAPAGKGVGEECQDSGSTGLYSGECQDGLMCYQPPGALLGAPKYCVQVCNKDYTDKDSEDTPCASGASCSCYVPTPCTPWKGPKDMEGGCYQFCSNAGSGDKCFWPQIQFGVNPR